MYTYNDHVKFPPIQFVFGSLEVSCYCSHFFRRDTLIRDSFVVLVRHVFGYVYAKDRLDVWG